MATIDKRSPAKKFEDSLFDEDGFPWLENGERMDQKTFHERYLKTPDGFKAELIGGIVYVMASPLKIRHGHADLRVNGWLYVYSAYTRGTRGQSNTTTILGTTSEPQPDSALLILPEFGGQSVDGDDEYTYGAPEFVAEVAWSSRSIDLNAKLRRLRARRASSNTSCATSARRPSTGSPSRTAGSRRWPPTPTA